MATAKKLPSGNWRCKAYYTDSNGKYTSKSFTAETKKEAEYLANQFLMEKEHSSKPENITLGELADRYIDNLSNILSPSTIAGYKKIRRTAFQSIINCRIGLLTKEAYQRAINDYCINRSYKTVLSAHSFFHKVLKENGIKIADTAQLPPKAKKEIEIPSTSEIQSFIQQISDTNIYLYCLFAVCLGLRKSEIIAIQWKDINFDENTVDINKARVKNSDNVYELKLPKTFSGRRELKIPKVLMNALPEPGEPNEFVLSETPDSYDSLYKRQSKKWGFNYNFHSLRHYFASIMLQSGIPNKYAKERMGHSTENMLINVYQHTFKSKQEEFDIKLDDFFSVQLAKKE